jgi:rod shape determining protein RodA
LKVTLVQTEERERVLSPAGKILRFFYSLDYIQIISMSALLFIGIYYIFSTGQQVGGNPDIWKKQLFFTCCGFTLWGALAFTDFKFWKHMAWLLYIFGIVALLIVLLFGEKRFGATRWLSLFGFLSVQPSEFAKITTLMMGAWVLSLQRFNIYNLKHVILFCIVIFFPFFLIMIEPDLGSSIILWPVAGAMLFAAGLKWKWILIVLISAMVSAPPAYMYLLKDYQKERIRIFLDPGRDPNDKGWNSRQSQLAVGSGGLYGKGLMGSTQSTLGFLPKTVSNSDFIFSVIAEETGFLGSTLIVFLYIMLIFSAFRTAVVSSDLFGKYLAIGIGSILFIHSAVNIGMTIRITPVTGLPLPLVSLGGTFIVSTMIALGLLQSIYIHSKIKDFK